jgi:hypothetical protein
MKKPWQSKTMFISFVAAALGVLGQIWPNANFAVEWINANGATVAMVLGFVGMGLRMITKDKVQLFLE